MSMYILMFILVLMPTLMPVLLLVLTSVLCGCEFVDNDANDYVCIFT